MDPKHAGEILNHLEKQHELLVDARQSMLDELHKYQIEEEMLMRKLHEVMSVHKRKKDGAQTASADGEAGALICKTNIEEVAQNSIREVVSTTGGGVKNPIIRYSRRKKQ